MIGRAHGGGGVARGEEENPGLRQVSLARLGEFGIAPKRELGQHFLFDDNILRMIMERLECCPEDVVLEIGAGLGVLTRALAEAATCVHAFEVDRELAAPLLATLQDRSNVHLYFEDVLKASLEDLRPLPTLCASNLPYSVAGSFIVEGLCRLPSVRRYCVMVQREVAERMTARPGTRNYGLLSVWLQLYADIVYRRSLSRTIFYPRPNVDSSLVVFQRKPVERLPQCEPADLEVVLHAAFGQRRKTVANALASGLGLSRQVTKEIAVELGISGEERAEQLPPEFFTELAPRVQRCKEQAGDWHSGGESAKRA